MQEPKAVKRVSRCSTPSGMPPPERSVLSIQLEKLANDQKEAVRNFSPEAVKLNRAMLDIDRYTALTDDPGIISGIKLDIAALQVSVEEAIKAVHLTCKLYNPWTVQKKTVNGKKRRADHKGASKVLFNAGKQLADMAKVLLATISQLKGLEEEAAILEKKVLDDSALPDFSVLNGTTSEAKKQKLCRKALQAAEVVDNEGIDRASCDGAGETVENPEAIPMEFKMRYNVEGSVIALTKEGAKAIMAARIKDKVASGDIGILSVVEHK